MSHDDCSTNESRVEESSGSRKETKNYYSTYNFNIRVSFKHISIVHDGNHNGVVRIFTGLKVVLEQWQLMERQSVYNSTTKVRFGTKMIHLGSVHDSNYDSVSLPGV